MGSSGERAFAKPSSFSVVPVCNFNIGAAVQLRAAERQPQAAVNSDLECQRRQQKIMGTTLPRRLLAGTPAEVPPPLLAAAIDTCLRCHHHRCRSGMLVPVMRVNELM